MPTATGTLDVSEIASCICFPALIGGEKWKKLPKMGSRKNKGIYYTTNKTFVKSAKGQIADFTSLFFVV